MKSVSAKWAAAIFWIAATSTGIWLLERYENKPGTSSPTPENWPTSTCIDRPANRPLLVMFAHPQCPCTRASIDELNRLLARCKGQLAATVLFLDPEDVPESWTQGSSWKRVAAIPNVAVGTDHDGREARRFGAETSGFVVVYSAHGRLLFRGGITAFRGHAGDNAGSEAIFAAVTGRKPILRETPAFGCSLFDKCELPPKKLSQVKVIDGGRRLE